MKRPRSDSNGLPPPATGAQEGLDAGHPAIAFHREVWVGDYWHVIREQFRIEYEDIFVHGRKAAPHSGVVYQGTVAEPAKFWRHCREALAKWVLSQIARYQPVRKTSAVGSDADRCLEVDYAALNTVHFLPSDAMMSSAYFGETPQGQQQASQRRSTYDLQLIRDLTFKSIESLRNTAAFIADVQYFVSSYDLPGRCARAVREIDAQIQALMDSRTGNEKSHHHGPGVGSRVPLLKPLIRRIPDNEKTTPAQRRIAGDLVEVGVQWPDGYSTDAVLCCDVKLLSRSTNNVRSVLVSAASWDRLHRCYAAFGAPRDAHRGYLPEAAVAGDDGERQTAVLADLRAAVVVLRYEHCLASGSLQLCADSALKIALNRRGYNVMDLCASPINAYMVDLQQGQSAPNPESGAAAAGCSIVAPRRYCSAFWDTDHPFGSMGSALLFDIHRTYDAFRTEDEALPQLSSSARPLHQEAGDAPLLLTLDVPYDEDLCELLFLKLAQDCKRFMASVEAGRAPSASPSSVRGPKWVDFVLVLPLWWNVALDVQRCPKRFVCAHDAAATLPPPAATTGAADMWALVHTHSDYLKQGLQVTYRWLRELPAAVAGDICDPEGAGRYAGAPHREGSTGGCGRPRSPYAAVFDAVFIRDSYTYFCTATNKPLTGVTATEVIGISLAPPVPIAADADDEVVSSSSRVRTRFEYLCKDMTSLRFEYTTAQEAEMFKRVIQNEDRLRNQFVSCLPEGSKRVWRGFDGDFTDALSNIQKQEQSPLASPTQKPPGRSVQLFSKKMRRVPLQSTLPPLTCLSLDKHLVVDTDIDKPNLKVHDSGSYTVPQRYPASTQTSSPLTGIPSSVPPMRAIPQPPAVEHQALSTPAGKLKGTPSFDTTSSVFSRGSSSFAGIKAKPGLPRSGSSTNGSTSTSQLGASVLAASNKTASQTRTSSTQREKIRSMSERLSRVEERIEESIAEEAKVTQSLEELKQILLLQNSGAASSKQ